MSIHYPASISGDAVGSLNGVDGFDPSYFFTDDGVPGTKDTAAIIITDSDKSQGSSAILQVTGFQQRGNHDAHPPEDD